jgi:cytoskeletal protein CcmA (bactofilin family)
MATTTVIGRASFVRGRVSGSGDLEIAGRVEGDVAVSGEVVIESTGLVASNVTAARIVVRGAVKGNLVAEEALLIESGARVVGDLRAPRVAIVQGGLVRGQVQTVGAAGARPRAVAAAAGARVSETKLRPIPAAAPPPPRPAKAAAPPPPAPPPPPARSHENHKPVRGAVLAGARLGPPAPVVPVLKKGTKAVQKKQR